MFPVELGFYVALEASVSVFASFKMFSSNEQSHLSVSDVLSKVIMEKGGKGYSKKYEVTFEKFIITTPDLTAVKPEFSIPTHYWNLGSHFVGSFGSCFRKRSGATTDRIKVSWVPDMDATYETITVISRTLDGGSGARTEFSGRVLFGWKLQR